MKFLASVLLALLALPALAQTAAPTFSPTWKWVAPVNCSDGTPVAPTTGTSNCTIVKYNLYTALQGQPVTLWGSVGPTVLSVQTPNTPAGIWCGQITASDSLAESNPSAQVCITEPPVAPGAPTNPTVTLATTSTIAYMLVPGNDTYGVTIVGTVPLGTACDATKPILTYFVIPHAAVTLTGPVNKLTAILGACS
jgi:hypothetical protein